MDQGVGLLLRALASLPSGPSGDEYLLVYTADNGAPFARGKTTMYEAGINEPLIISFPGGPAGGRTAVPASLLDIAPTILDWHGIPIPPRMLGKSLLPVAKAAEGGSPGGGGLACLPNTPPQHSHSTLLLTENPPTQDVQGYERKIIHPLLNPAWKRPALALGAPPTPLALASFSQGNVSYTFGSFQAHEVQMYFPTRYAIAADPNGSTISFKYKLLYHIAGASPAGEYNPQSV